MEFHAAINSNTMEKARNSTVATLAGSENLENMQIHNFHEERAECTGQPYNLKSKENRHLHKERELQLLPTWSRQCYMSASRVQLNLLVA